MNASIKSRVAVATLGLLGTVGLLAGSASAEPSDAPSDQGTVVVGTAGNTRYVATDGEVIWGDATPATCAGVSFSDLTVIDTDLGPVYVGTGGNVRYVITSNEVIWGPMTGGPAT
jgi:hypothetical protein